MNKFDSSTFMRALTFATIAHGDQKRKYTHEPYIVHPIAVAEQMMQLPENMSERNDMIIAALLHDVVEDTPVDLATIQQQFGLSVAGLVDMLTKASTKADGNRAKRKEIDQAKLAGVSNPARLIKLADLIDNTASIAVRDPSFAKVYLPEKWKLIEVIKPDYDPTGLYTTAKVQTAHHAERLGITLPQLV